MAEGSPFTPPPVLLPMVSTTSTAAMLLVTEGAKEALGITSPVQFFQWKTELPPTTHPIYSLVGQVASEWAHLEHTLDLIIWDLAGIDHVAGACITAQLMGLRPRCLTVIAQLTQRAKTKPNYERFITQVNKLLESSYTASDRRNRIVHDPWYGFSATGLVLRRVT